MDKRHKYFYFACIMLLTAILLRMILLAGEYGSSYRDEADRISVKNGSLPAIRGRIFSPEGQLLVWSERCYDLTIAHPVKDDRRLANLTKALERSLNITVKTSSKPLPGDVVKYNLTANELEVADKLAEHFPELSVELRWERKRNTTDAAVGEVRQLNGMEVGISGLEKKFDQQLSGTPGDFTVMLDRHGLWLNSTFRLLSPPVSGKDVFLEDDLSTADTEL